MNPEQRAKTPSHRTGVLATLANLLRTAGTGAPSNRRNAKSLASFFSISFNLADAPEGAQGGTRMTDRLSSLIAPFSKSSVSENLADAPEGAQNRSGQGRNGRACSAREGVRTPAWTVLCGTLACLAALGMAPSGASASQARLLAGTFGAASNPAPFPANPYPLGGSAEHLAVDSTSHDVYVADSGNHRVEKFDAAGNFLFMLGKEVNKGKVEEGGKTEAEQNLCAVGEECQAGKDLGAHTPLEEPRFLAVDSSSHDLYLSNGSHASAGLVEKFDSAGHPIESWATSGTLDGSTATNPAGPFGPLRGLATDPAGNLWVNAGEGSESQIKTFEFDQGAGFKGGFAEVAGELALDAEDNLYFKGLFLLTVRKYLPSGKPVGDVAPSKAEFEANTHFGISGLTVDAASGDLYLAGGEGNILNQHGIIKRYDSSCHPVFSLELPQVGCAPVEAFGAGLISNSPKGLAIDSASKALYVADDEHVAVFAFLNVPDVTTTKPQSPTHTSATLTGTVDPSGIELNPGLEGCRFEWVEAALYEPAAANPYAAGHLVACNKTAAEIGSGTGAVEVQAPITGLEAGKTYHYRLLASNHNDVNESIEEPSLGEDVAFGPPLLESASVLGASANAATLQAEVNPRNLDTRVRIEYVTQADFEAEGFSEPLSTPESDIGSAGSSQAATFQLSGLAPQTAYRYRAVAENVLGEGPEAVIGPEPPHTFTTQAAGPFSLPDSRQWQLVSPPDKHGASIEPISESGVLQTAASGAAITYLANAPTEAQPPGYTNLVQVLSRRGEGGWSTRDIAIPHAAPTGSAVGPGPEYKFFNRELTLGAVHPFGPFNPGLSEEASEQTTYLHDLSGACGSACFRPLVTGKEPFANVPPGTPFGEGTRLRRRAPGSQNGLRPRTPRRQRRPRPRRPQLQRTAFPGAPRRRPL